MENNQNLQILLAAVVTLLGYGLLVAVVAVRRGLRQREPAVLFVYLLLAAILFLSAPQYGPRGVWPVAGRVAPYALVGLGVAFWGLGRAVLLKRPLWLSWLPAGVVLALLIALDAGLIPLSGAQVGSQPLTASALALLAGAVTAAAYSCAADGLELVEYAHRHSPLHRNRITYWLLGTAASAGGAALLLPHREAVQAAGTVAHWLGAALLTYIVVQPQLPDLATGVRRAISYLLATLIPAVVTVGLGLGLVYALLRPSPPVRDILLTGLVLTGVVVFLLYRPLGSLTRRLADRLLFGRRVEAQAVVREYSQAVTQVLSLEKLAETAVQVIDRALRVQHGVLLVVEEKRDDGWWLRTVAGTGSEGGRPHLIPVDSPLSAWLVERGEPLHQYTLDVDPRFRVLSPADLAAWRQLNMEVLLPIKHSGNLVGLLALGLRRSGQPYTAAELGLLATLADQTAIALENAILFDSVQRRARQLALLNEIGRAITSSLDLGPTVQLLSERIAASFKGSAGFVFLTDEEGGGLRLQNSYGPGALTGPFQTERGRGLVGWVAKTQESVAVPYLATDERYAPSVEGALAPGAGSALCAPLVARGETLGVILITAPGQTVLGVTELNLLNSIAAFAAIAIENIRQVLAREALLRQQLDVLRIEIDQIKRTQHVEEITETEYFRSLQSQARQLRERSRRGT